MAKIFELKDALHVKTSWVDGHPKDDLPSDYKGIYSRPHSTKGIEYMLVNPTMDTKMMGASLCELEPNIETTTTGIHSHKYRESAYIVLEGNATIHLNGNEYQLNPNTVVFMPPGDMHGIVRTGKNGVKFIIAWADTKSTT